ncbi:tRNA (adenosine(37)-N6)-threonylcarbamoyltransferase complex ATPase subunit type 1 TsaE [Legionella sp. km772]|uniref:tRNA (adenosine(37)-N6)-threonylcarbamoyltransferase complex ATPase subunit type 1 TsaE n=1 Tax=Legionella sp. km772 TaxID=2498111 RepID=UPI000F8E177E|nr:tRNA (adenosine(37)-N6)-threonylcarbamoyltransferase complex ATPase subunit type 1 TsaE [Legionella sp. km772]RUR12542.1 tRNA (adenosine(37)-N6)-threonylcarbamoyltransferase complex ATPase subunit type 1 TsaE [Legionella sp. km772]
MIKNDKVTLFLDDEQASEQWAKRLATQLKAPLTLSFSGEIGAGKTTIIRAMLRALGIQCAIKSPTFSIVESYTCADFVVHHFDLYRIHHEEELEYIGFRDFFMEQNICCIEWAEHAGQLLPAVDVRFKLMVKESGRELEITAFSAMGRTMLEGLTGE